MKSLIIIILLFCLAQYTTAQTLITIKQDGTGDYTTIQEGVDASIDGDTILVWPGIYQEHIYAYQKNFILGSLNLITNDPTYITQTVIDGTHNGRCIEVYFSEEGTTIQGFTIVNGFAFGDNSSFGGGFYLKQSAVGIINCTIEDNRAYGGGGGINIALSDVFISGSTIRNNHAHLRGGGINKAAGELTFDSINRCNIYLNYAGFGTDIQSGLGSTRVYADTFTVLEPDYYYLYADSSGFAVNTITFDINAGKIQQTYQDLYVSPDGDNSNDGFSPSSPLKNISYALMKAASDTLSPDTIHLASGYYAPSTGERFPLSLKADLSIVGTHRDSVILDAEHQTYILQGIMYADDYLLKNFTVQHGDGDSSSPYGRGAFHAYENRHACMQNLIFQGNKGYYNSVGSIQSSNGFKVINSIFRDNVGGKALYAGHAMPLMIYDTIKFINCQFIHNIPPDFHPPFEDPYGGAVTTIGHNIYVIPELFNTQFYNCLFHSNYTKNNPYGSPGTTSLGVARYSKTDVVNCTFSGNTSGNPLGANIGVTDQSILSIYNSVLFDNSPAELYMFTDTGYTYLNVDHSLVQGGEGDIILFNPGNILNYDPSNINTDPLFDTTSMYPYSLSAGSPCINAGTLDLPPGVELPETDLAGNPRVYDGYVDMGAYEYGPWVSIPDHNSKLKTQNPKLLKAWPNPFRFETNISYTVPEKGRTVIRVYDLNGRCIKTLMDVHGQAGEGQIQWSGTNDQGGSLKSGTYIISISVNGKEMDDVKVVLTR